MKKSACLVVSALSLGIVSFATLSSAVSAVDPATANATITVTVPGTLGVSASATASIPSLAPGAISTADAGVSTTNNTGNPATLTLKSATADTGLKPTAGTAAAIPAGVPAADGNTAAWGYKVGTGAYKAITAAGESLGTDTGAASKNDYNVTYGASSAYTTAAGSYSADVVYTISQS